MDKAIINHANTHLIKWSKSKEKLVVAIDGYSGAGKTTLLHGLAKKNKNIVSVHRDDFLFSRAKVVRLFKKAKDKSRVFELSVLDVKRIERLIRLFHQGKKPYTTKVYNPLSGKIDVVKVFDLTKPILVIEGVFMYHPKLTNHLWDRRIYIKGNKREIKARRIKREKAKWGKDYIPETRSDSYFRQVVIALERYEKLYNPAKQSDLVLRV